MPDIKWEEFGLAGLSILLVVIFIWKLPEIIRAFSKRQEKESSTGTEDERSAEDLRKLLENNTVAITELTQFLKTQAEVDKVKEKQANKQLDNIESKIDDLSQIMTKHYVKCESRCHI